MPEYLRLTPADARRVPWKNGRGVTDELAIGPPGASFERGDFEWRISKASIEAPGPFSTFPGYDRVLVVTDGDGLTISHGENVSRVRVPRLTPYRFSGEWPTSAELTAGPVVDFNVMVRRDRLRVEMEMSAPGRRPARVALAAGDAFVHVIAGPMIARSGGDGRMFALSTHDSLCIRGARGGEELQLVGDSDDCVALLVRFTAV